MRTMRLFAAVAALIASSPIRIAAQLPAGATKSTTGFPIDVVVKPATVRLGGTVTIRGWC